MQTGNLIVIEGGEGAGKGTVLKAIAAKYPEFTYTREPGGTALAESIRTIILDKASTATSLTELACVFAARADHIDKIILPRVLEGKTVVCDRFDLSSYAYQVYAPKAVQNEELFLALRKAIIPDIIPIYYIILDIDPQIGLERKKSQNEEQLFETKPKEFHNLVREGLKKGLQKIKTTSSSIKGDVCVDASGDREVVKTEVLKHINDWLGI